MPSRFLIIFSLLCCATLFVFCKKDTVSTPESPFFDFFNESMITIDTVEQAADSWEYGFVFSPLKPGRITEFEVKMPATGDFTVSLWNVTGPSPALLRTKAITATAEHQSAASAIQEVTLEAGDKYGITVLANAFYRLSKPGNTSFDFPRTIGNIRIESFNEMINNTSISSFPIDSNDTRVAPCVNVIFIAD